MLARKYPYAPGVLTEALRVRLGALQEDRAVTPLAKDFFQMLFGKKQVPILSTLREFNVPNDPEVGYTRAPGVELDKPGAYLLSPRAMLQFIFAVGSGHAARLRWLLAGGEGDFLATNWPATIRPRVVEVPDSDAVLITKLTALLPTARACREEAGVMRYPSPSFDYEDFIHSVSRYPTMTPRQRAAATRVIRELTA